MYKNFSGRSDKKVNCRSCGVVVNLSARGLEYGDNCPFCKKDI